MVAPQHELFLRQAVKDGLIVQHDVKRAASVFSGQRSVFGIPVFHRNVEIARLLFSKFGYGLPSEFYRASLFYSAPSDAVKKLPQGVQHILREVNLLAEARTDLRAYSTALSHIRNPGAVIVHMAAALNGLRKILERRVEDNLFTRAEATRIARLVKDFHVPVAGLLGLHSLKNDLGESAFQVLEPREYERVDAELSDVEQRGARFLVDLQRIAHEHADKLGVRFSIRPREGRKQAFSAWEKTRRRGVTVRDLHDILAFKVVLHTSDSQKCYEFFNRLAADRRLHGGVLIRNDYLGERRKPNGYEALHLEVHHGVHGKELLKFEIQVKTEEMEQRTSDASAVHEVHKGGNFEPTVVRAVQRIGDHLHSMIDTGKAKPMAVLTVFVNGVGTPIAVPEGTVLVDVISAVIGKNRIPAGDVRQQVHGGELRLVKSGHRVSSGQVFHVSTVPSRFTPRSSR